MFESFFTKIAGKFVGKKLNLEGGTPMENSKPWYKSMTIWSDVATILVGAIALADKDFGTHIAANRYYELALTFLGAIGIYGRSTANTTITK